ncbi:Protein of unknown function [Lactobacillus delbrueckii subsp. bulgaricus]|nr:Protein of unknown function [Lactobacillus delbrueckii subsp. bulgaricus]
MDYSSSRFLHQVTWLV